MLGTCLSSCVHKPCHSRGSGIGLLFTTASVFQMLRGSVILFVALFSVAFLGRKLRAFQWTGLAVCVAGITLVGASSYMTNAQSSAEDASRAMLGNALIVIAQLCSAVRSCAEYNFWHSCFSRLFHALHTRLAALGVRPVAAGLGVPAA